MKKLPKTLAALLVIAFVFSACTGKKETTSSADIGSAPVLGADWGSMGLSSGGVAISNPGQFPIVRNRGDIRVTMLVTGHPAIIDWNTNAMSRWVEQQTNIVVEYKTIPLEGRLAALSLELASNTYPDAFMTAGMNLSLLTRYGPGEGRLKPVTDLIKTHAPNLQNIFRDFPGYPGLMTMLDGNIYTMPNVNQCYHCTMYYKMWINAEFLKAVGKPMPTTTDELVDVLKAFRDNDPNGNGLRDEIPYAATGTGGWGNTLDYFLMNSFTFYTAETLGNGSALRTLGLYLDNGIVKTPWAEPGTIEGLRFLNMLVRERLLYEGSFTASDSELINLLESGSHPRVGLTTGGYGGTFSDMGGSRYQMYEPMMPLQGPSGLRQIPKDTYDIGYNGFYISADSKYVEALVKWADLLYDFEATMDGYYGPKDTHWRAAVPGETGLDGKPALYSILVPWQETEPQNIHWVQMNISNRDAAFRAGEAYDQSIPLYSGEGLEKLLFDTTARMELYANSKSVMPPVKFTEQQEAINSVPLTDISNLIKQYVPGFISGANDIDREYNTFLQRLRNAGLDAVVASYQAGYNQQYK
jgi:putative aldouronate transport system substrate-binding protein